MNETLISSAPLGCCCKTRIKNCSSEPMWKGHRGYAKKPTVFIEIQKTKQKTQSKWYKILSS